MEEWKVDIVLLPSGFQTAYNGVKNAIANANICGILTFASPSNNGNCTDIYFPGRLYSHGKVITLFSTNAMVRASTAHTFNPSPIPTAEHRSFAVLGEYIELENYEALLSGTSFSTMIGAGVAARIIDFSRHRDYRGQLRGANDLRKVEGMFSVFGKMAQRPDNGYRCMAPWKLLRSARVMDGEDRPASLRRQRSELCDSLNEALGDLSNA